MLWDATGQINLLLQSIFEDPRWLIPVTSAGDRIYLLILVPVVFYIIGRRDALFLLFATAGTFYVNSLLKLIFHRPRPFWVTQMGVYAFEASFGFPSGHAFRMVRRFCPARPSPVAGKTVSEPAGNS
jgi:membrane-associated phospholipid phosphatase